LKLESVYHCTQHSEKYPKSPVKNPCFKNYLAGALRYTFALADVAVIVAIGDKVSAGSFLYDDLKINFRSAKHFFSHY